MKDNIKIYHILDHFIPHYSGYTFRTKNMLSFQREFGIDVVAIISPKHSENLKPYEIIDKIPCYRSQNINGGFKYNVPYIREINLMNHFKKSILKIIRSNRLPDIIHAHSPILCGIPAMNVARKFKIPIVYEVRALWEDAAVDLGQIEKSGLRYHVTRYLETNLFHKVDKIITICEGLKKELLNRGIDEKKIYIVPNGVDTDKFRSIDKNSTLVKKYNLQNKVILGFIGSFYNYEGLILLVKAMPHILSKAKDSVLILVGTGEQETILKDLINQMHLNQSVILTGQVPHNKILDYYSIMDILVYPREKIRLTELVTPLKPLEAMSMGKVVLGSDVGGIKELITDGKNGLLFKAGNRDDLVNKCLRLISDEAERKKIGPQAKNYVNENRTWKKIIQSEIKFYESLLKESNDKSN